MPTQTYANHRAIPHPLFVVAALLAVGAILLAGWAAVRMPSPATVALLLLSISMVLGLIISRRQAQIVQDRIILIDMRRRLEHVLAGQDAWQQLSRGQLIALRFASDRELPNLVERALAGAFATVNDLKRAIIDWQADTHRV